MTSHPNLSEDGWELENAIEKHKEHPDSFKIPGDDELSKLKIGDRVKLLFLLLGRDEEGLYAQGERMWVTIAEIKDQSYKGILESTPQTNKSLKPNDTILFRKENIAAILISKNDARHPFFRKSKN